MRPYSATLISYILCTASLINALPASQTGSVSWQPCSQQNATIPIQCGTLTVPLDYSDPLSNKTLDLQLVKVSAVKRPRKGSILFNPGGPGGSGRNIVGQGGGAFLVATGGYHDLIGFDPRGTGYTIPFSCYNTTVARELGTPPLSLVNASDTAVREVWAQYEATAEACFETNQANGEFLGTAFVARDMIRIAEALDDDGLLRYWGFSYGTVLGATAATMFPDKIDRMVLDGVVNAHQYYNGIGIEAGAQSDTVLNGFCETCFSHPVQCPLAQDSISATDLSDKIFQLLENLKYNPIAVGTDPDTGLISYSTVKAATFSYLYSPATSWQNLAAALHVLLTKNVTAYADAAAFFNEGVAALSALPEASPGTFSPDTPDALMGIQCGDTSLRSHNLTSLLPLVDATVAASRIAGDTLAILEPLSCAPWKFTAKERYSGNFQAQTKNPIMFVSSPFDPITPLVSAYNMSSGFDGSVVLQHNGYGHTSLQQVSLCTVKHVRAYFVNGTLPPPGTTCQPDQTLFSGETIEETLAPLAKMIQRGFDPTDDANDARLPAAVAHISKQMKFKPRFSR